MFSVENRFLNTIWAVGLTYWIVYFHFWCILTYAIIYVLIHHSIFFVYFTSWILFIFPSTLVLISTIAIVIVLSIGLQNFRETPYVTVCWNPWIHNPIIINMIPSYLRFSERSGHVRSSRYPMNNWGRTRKHGTLIRIRMVYNKTRNLEIVRIHKETIQVGVLHMYLNNIYVIVLSHYVMRIWHKAIN